MLRLKQIIFILLLFSIPLPSIATQNLSADGMGKTPQAAQDDALRNLANSIFVQVESNSKVYQSDQGENYFNSTTQTSSDLALMGVEYQTFKMMKQYHCTATMDLAKAKNLYHAKLKSLTKNINDQLKALTTLPMEAHYDHLSRLLASYEGYEKYLTVFTYISGKSTNQFQPNTTRFALQNKLASLEKHVNSLNLAAQLLTKGINEKKLYIRPARLDGTHSITSFSKALLDHLKSKLESRSSPDHANFFMNGSYQITKQGILVTYSLSDRKGHNIKTHAVSLTPTSYQSYEVRPKNPDFDALLHAGYVIPSDFKVDLATNKGSRNLAFEGGDELRILAKLNQPGYVYVVGYVNDASPQLSYLLDIGSEDDSNQHFDANHFIRYIGAENVGKWLELSPPFEVCPPYGTESLQIIASNQPLNNAIPNATWDEALGYYVISKDLKKTIATTRGFKRKKNKKGTKKITKSAEAVMMISTFKGKKKHVCE